MKRIISFVLCAAMLMSSFVFVAQAADPQVQSVIDAINAIGDVHRNETLLENLSFDGYTVNSIPTSELWETQEWSAYAPYNRLEFKEAGSDVKKAVVLKWNRDFQVTFQFVPAQNNIENPKKDVAIFGGKISNVWVGYHFGKEQFFIGNNTSEGPDTPTAYRHLSEVMKLDPNTAYTMTVQFVTAKDADGNITIEDDKIMNGGTPGYVTIFLDGKEIVSSKGQLPKNGNRTNPKYMPFNPYKVNNDAWSWPSFIMFPCGTICNIVRFEASTLDATDDTPWGTPVGAPAPWPYETHPDDDTVAYYIAANTEFLNKPIRVHDMAENFVANGGWYKSSFTCNAYVDSGEKIAAAKAAYMALTPPQKKEVSNYADLVSKMRTYYTMQPAYGGINVISEEALKVVDLIDAIGVVTTSSGDAIKAAEDAYNALTNELKAEVYNYDVLVCSLEEYDAFTNPAVIELIAAIDALAPITLDSKAALEDCESKYAAFNSALKASVTNYSVLVEARKTYDTLCVEEVRALIGAIGDVTKESADAVNAAKTKYDALRDDLKARVADIKPVLDAAKTDLRMINLSGLDYTDPAVITEVRLTKNYYQIQTAAAKALMKNKSYLDSALDTVIDVVEAKHIDSAIDSIGDISFMDGTSSVNGIGYLGKRATGYTNLSVWDPLHEKTTAEMHGPFKVSFDIVIKRWINNEDDNSARIAGYLGTGVAMAYNYVEKKFVIGNSGDGGAGGMYNPTGDYASSDVVELKLNVPYNIAFEVDRDHLAIYLNGKQVAYTSELAMDPTSYFLFYPAGLDMIVTGYEMIFNGEVLSYYDNADKMFEERTFGKSGNVILGNETWVGFNSGWNVEALTTNDNVVNDSGYIVETLYNRYMALNDSEKALVTKADTLIAKYQEYTGKKNQGLITEAINAINAIGDVTLDSIDVITAAEYAYSEVPDEIKSQVTNADVLTAARAKYDELYGNDLNDQIASLGEITADKIDVVKGLKAEYDAMTENQKSYVTNKAILDAALDDLAEFAKANPVIDAIQSFIGADFDDETPIAGLVREYTKNGNNYTLFASDNVAKNYFGTKKYQIDYDFKYTDVESAIRGVIQGSNGDGAVLTGIDIAHSLVFIKVPAGPFGLQDPQSYTVSAPFTFSANRWYHFTAIYENESVKILIDGKEKLVLSEIDKEYFEESDWYIMQSYGIDGFITNATITTNAEPGVIPEGLERTWVSDSIGGTVRDPATTIGQENKDNVTRARVMYNELSPKARTAVTNYRFLTSTEAVLGMTSPSDSALAVIDMINALDRDSDQTAIDAALDAYKALSTRDKRSVTNYGKIQKIIDERAAADVEAKIAALTVESSNDDFALAQRAYDNLTAAQKALVTNYDRIAELRSAKAVKAVVDAIAALNDDSAEADIAAAQAAYNALTDAEKAQVTNYTALEELIARISAAKVKAVVDAIAELTDDSSSDEVNGVKAQYDALTDAEKAQVTNIDKLIDLVNKFSASVAQKVIDAINGLSASSTEDEVMAVKAQYDALTADEKAHVTNYDALKALIDAISAAKAKVVSDLIAKLDENSDEADFAAAEAAYAALSDDAKAFVTNYSRIADLRGAKNVTAMIAALTNESSDEDVAAALAAYNALSEMGQLYVKNYAHLEAVRSAKAVAAVIAAIDALSKDSTDDEIDAAEEAYEALTDEEKALVTNYDRIEEIREQKKDPAVQAVIQMIAKLDVNSTNDELLAVISAYEALTDEQKAKVLNYDMIAEICDQKAAAVVAQVNALPDVYFADIFHHESAVKAAMSTYEVLIDSSKAKVTNYEKLKAIADKLAALHAWDADKQVNILNSTLVAMSKYTQETIDNFAKQPAVGMHYFFEEVGYVERGDSTTGYFAFEEAENKSVKDQRYVNLEFDIKVTNVDVTNGWPMLYKFMIGDTHVGYDFVNKAFFCGSVTGMDHGALSRTDVVNPHDFEFGVWHHLAFVLDAENVKIVFDGETVLEGTFSGEYSFLITYPWLCDLEMTNVVYTDKFGKEMLSPFRNATNNPTGWSKRSNAKDAVMLDHVKTSVEDARDAYEKLTDEQKAQIVGIDVLDKVEAMIELSGKNEIVITDGTADVQAAAEGDTVTVTANEAPAGKVFDKWEVVAGGVTLADANAASTTFVMGAEKVELKAVYKDAGHAVKVTDGTADTDSAAAGATVTITAGAAPAGKVFDKWEVVSGGVTLADANAASTTFVMGDADVEIKAVYKNAVMMGDADGNGKVNAKDIIAVMRHMLGNTPAGFIEEAADMDANGKVNAKDIIAIMRAMLAK